MTKRLMIVGASAYQHYIYTTARQLGLWVCAVDGDPDAPLFKVCDDYRPIDFSNVDAVVAYARECKVDAVATVNLDQGMNAVAAIRNCLGLAPLDAVSVLAGTRKDLMRKAWREAGVRQPDFWVFDEHEQQDVLRLTRELGRKLIIKPVDNAAKRGIGVLQGSQESLERIVTAAFAHSKSRKVIVETFVDGTLIFAPTYLSRDGVKVCIMRQTATQKFVQVRFDAPFSFGARTDALVRHEAKKAAACFGSGPFHTEAIVDHEGMPWFVETSPRVSYATVSLSRLVDGFDPVLAVLQEALRQQLEPPMPQARTPYAILSHLQPPQGSVFRRAGLRDRLPDGVHEIVPVVPDGHVVRPFATNAERVLYFTVHADTRAKAEALRDHVEQQLLHDCFSP